MNQLIKHGLQVYRQLGDLNNQSEGMYMQISTLVLNNYFAGRLHEVGLVRLLTKRTGDPTC